MKTTWTSVGVLLLAFLYPCVSNADCAPEQRKVVLDKSAAEGGESVVKSYRCSLQPQSKNADLRVEFYRANEETAALILAGGGSKKLRLTLGSPKVLNNDVWRFYADLVNAFGITEEIPPEPLSSFNVGGASTPDVVSVKKFRHLDNSIHVSNVFYPAVDEIAALRKKTLPSDLSYFYKNSGCEAGTADCEKLGDDTFSLVVWRPMEPSDVTNYAARAASYNADVRKTRKGCESDGCSVSASAPKLLQLMARAGGANWPDDLLIMTGTHIVQSGDLGGCEPPGTDYWSFMYPRRRIYVEFALVENASSSPISIDGLVGKYEDKPELRPAAQAADASGGTAAETIPIGLDALAPGYRVLIPSRILFGPLTYEHGLFDTYKKSMEEMHRLFGARGYKKTVDTYNRIPQFRNYAYGPSLSMAGLIANGTRLDFAKRQAATNSIDLSVVAEFGSCPYLLSWDEKDREWVEHGKVLHKAPAKDKSYTEARDFEGLRTRFRIEEREPEIAHIEAAALVVTFDGGETLRLAPAMNEAQASLRLEVDLAWGEQLDLNFRLPEGRSPDRVVKSQLEITGYYERYNNLASGEEQPRLSSAPEMQRAE